MGNTELSSEFISTVLDPYRGGAALMANFPPSSPVRAVFSGSVNLFKAELYDRTDLLEPLVRANFQDFLHSDTHTSGENAIGWIDTGVRFPRDLGIHSTCDFTFDNYHATGVRNTPIGFPGTPQVI